MNIPGLKYLAPICLGTCFLVSQQSCDWSSKQDSSRLGAREPSAAAKDYHVSEELWDDFCADYPHEAEILKSVSPSVSKVYAKASYSQKMTAFNQLSGTTKIVWIRVSNRTEFIHNHEHFGIKSYQFAREAIRQDKTLNPEERKFLLHLVQVFEKDAVPQERAALLSLLKYDLSRYKSSRYTVQPR